MKNKPIWTTCIIAALLLATVPTNMATQNSNDDLDFGVIAPNDGTPKTWLSSVNLCLGQTTDIDAIVDFWYGAAEYNADVSATPLGPTSSLATTNKISISKNTNDGATFNLKELIPQPTGLWLLEFDSEGEQTQVSMISFICQTGTPEQPGQIAQTALACGTEVDRVQDFQRTHAGVTTYYRTVHAICDVDPADGYSLDPAISFNPDQWLLTQCLIANSGDFLSQFQNLGQMDAEQQPTQNPGGSAFWKVSYPFQLADGCREYALTFFSFTDVAIESESGLQVEEVDREVCETVTTHDDGWYTADVMFYYKVHRVPIMYEGTTLLIDTSIEGSDVYSPEEWYGTSEAFAVRGAAARTHSGAVGHCHSLVPEAKAEVEEELQEIRNEFRVQRQAKAVMTWAVLPWSPQAVTLSFWEESGHIVHSFEDCSTEGAYSVFNLDDEILLNGLNVQMSVRGLTAPITFPPTDEC